MLHRTIIVLLLPLFMSCTPIPTEELTTPATEVSPVTAEALLQAAARGLLDKARYVLSRNPELVYARDARGLTPLHLASRPGLDGSIAPLAEYGEVVKLAIEYGADVNAIGEDGVTPLYLAASYPTVGSFMTYNGRPYAERLDEIQMGTIVALLEAGAELDAPINNGFTAVQAAVVYQHPAIAVYLAQRGASIFTSNDIGWSACERAFSDDVIAVQELCRDSQAIDLSTPESTLEGYIDSLRMGNSDGVRQRYLGNGFNLKKRIDIAFYTVTKKTVLNQNDVDAWGAIPPAQIGDVELQVNQLLEDGEQMFSYWMRNVDGQWMIFSHVAWGVL